MVMEQIIHVVLRLQLYYTLHLHEVKEQITCCITYTIILYFTFTGGVFVDVQGAVGLHRDDLRVRLL